MAYVWFVVSALAAGAAFGLLLSLTIVWVLNRIDG